MCGHWNLATSTLLSHTGATIRSFWLLFSTQIWCILLHPFVIPNLHQLTVSGSHARQTFFLYYSHSTVGCGAWSFLLWISSHLPGVPIFLGLGPGRGAQCGTPRVSGNTAGSDSTTTSDFPVCLMEVVPSLKRAQLPNATRAAVKAQVLKSKAQECSFPSAL